ncbi:MAG: protein kinase, partial [Planctomycetes bacterium]|nr:protein kinase [Planctomycetota bacterium]
MLTDFGLAKDLASDARVTRSGTALGTPCYMPPEQAEGRVRDVDERSDVWSAGATLYELLAAQPPFEGESAGAVVRKVLTEDPVPPSRWNRLVPRDLETVCLKCLEKDPSRRYPSAAALAEDLGRFLEGEPILARPVSAPERLWRKAARHKALAAALAALAVALVGGGAAAASLSGAWRGERAAKSKAEEDRVAAEEAHRSAVEDARTAERTLGKSLRAGRVMRTAFAKLGRVQDELKRASFRDRGRVGERAAILERHRGEVEGFLRAVPPDSASQAAALAVEGWLRLLAGREEEGFAAFREARARDPEVVWGYLLEAMAWLAVYLDAHRVPFVEMHGEGLRLVDPPTDRALLEKARAEFDRLVQAALRSCRFDREEAESQAEVLRGFARLRGDDWKEAEAALDRALALGDLAWIEEEAIWARAVVRMRAGKFGEGAADVRTILDRGMENGDLLLMLSTLLRAQGIRAHLEGGDPSAFFREAVRSCDRAAALSPSSSFPRTRRAQTRAQWGELLEARGADPSALYEEAEAELRQVLGDFPGDPDLPGVLGQILALRAGRLQERGQDGRAAWAEAVRFLEIASGALLGEDHLYNLACALSNLGEARASAGEDPSGEYRRALELFDRMIARDPGGAVALVARGNTLRRVARRALDAGERPEPVLEKALEDARKAESLAPGSPSAILLVGNLHFLKGEAARARGGDPREAYRAALPWFDRLADAPAPPLDALWNRGNTRLSLAEAELAAGGDPREDYRGAGADYRRMAALRPEPGFRRALGYVEARLAECDARYGGDPDPGLAKALGEFAAVLE